MKRKGDTESKGSKVMKVGLHLVSRLIGFVRTVLCEMTCSKPTCTSQMSQDLFLCFSAFSTLHGQYMIEHVDIEGKCK